MAKRRRLVVGWCANGPMDGETMLKFEAVVTPCQIWIAAKDCNCVWRGESALRIIGRHSEDDRWRFARAPDASMPGKTEASKVRRWYRWFITAISGLAGDSKSDSRYLRKSLEDYLNMLLDEHGEIRNLRGGDPSEGWIVRASAPRKMVQSYLFEGM